MGPFWYSTRSLHIINCFGSHISDWKEDLELSQNSIVFSPEFSQNIILVNLYYAEGVSHICYFRKKNFSGKLEKKNCEENRIIEFHGLEFQLVLRCLNSVIEKVYFEEKVQESVISLSYY